MNEDDIDITDLSEHGWGCNKCPVAEYLSPSQRKFQCDFGDCLREFKRQFKIIKVTEIGIEVIKIVENNQ